MSHLIPELRTDKNGKTSTRWVKPSASSDSARVLPAPTPVVSDLEENLTVITDAVKRAKVNSMAFNSALRRASRKEIALLSKAIEDDPVNFPSILIRGAGGSGKIDLEVSMALVYDKENFPEGYDASKRAVVLRNSINTAYSFMKITPKVTDLNNNHAIHKEDDLTIERIRRFVATTSITLSRITKAPDYELLKRAVDETRTDHEATLSILRSEPTATAAQIDFILSGGSSPVSAGAL